MHRATALLVLLLTTPAGAGVIYHFQTRIATHHGAQTVGGRVWSEGSNYRMELDPSGASRQYDIAISRDADQTATLINLSERTIYDRPPHKATRSSILLHLPFSGSRVQGSPRISYRQAGQETIAGRVAAKHVVEIEYDLFVEYDDAPIRGRVNVVATVWTTDTLPALPFRREVKTAFPELDQQIVAAFAAIDGFSLRHELIVSRTMEGGLTQTETVVTTVDDLTVREIPAYVFELPVGFRTAKR